MKKLILAFLTICMLFSTGVYAFNEEDSVCLMINGEYQELDVPPIIVDGRTMVPVRAISEFLEYDVKWDAENRRVEITNDSDVLEIFIDNTTYYLNGEKKTLDVPAFIKEGRTLVPVRLIAESMGCEVDWIAEIRTVTIDKYKTVYVENVKEFLNAIESNTTIILTGNEYNMSELVATGNDNLLSEEVYDGREYIIENVQNLTIQAAEGVNPTLLVEPRYANVLNFRDCNNIKVSGITAGHTIEQGECVGGVINFESSFGLNVEDCHLYGCGTYGVIGYESNFISVNNSEIYECTYGGVDFSECNVIEITDCTIRNCAEFSLFSFSNVTDARITNCVVKDSEVGSVISSYDSEVWFEDCIFDNILYDEFASGTGISIVNCTY